MIFLIFFDYYHSLNSFCSGAKFESIPNPNHSNRSEVMNGANTCTRLLFEGNEKNYCKLSYKLLLSLKETIKAYCGSPSGIPQTRRINHNTTEVKPSLPLFHVVIFL